ncbi:MAG: hypothetical protein ACRC1I_00105, partial [Pseudomonas proteolytica]|uniref:hypothetical protein n=1 Tax=Pseudomonas proteolytica TaxID=219574 RepID=UPI003F30E70B
LGRVGTRAAGRCLGAVQSAEINDHVKKPLGIWTLAMFSAIPGQTLGSIDNKPVHSEIMRTV